MNGISDKVQAYLVIAGSVAFAIGGYLSVQTSQPSYVLIGGILQAAALGLKEALGSQTAH